MLEIIQTKIILKTMVAGARRYHWNSWKLSYCNLNDLYVIKCQCWTAWKLKWAAQKVSFSQRTFYQLLIFTAHTLARKSMLYQKGFCRIIFRNPIYWKNIPQSFILFQRNAASFSKKIFAWKRQSGPFSMANNSFCVVTHLQ